jgi:hypothetical protein
MIVTPASRRRRSLRLPPRRANPALVLSILRSLESEEEVTAAARLGLYPDAAAVTLDDLAANRQPNARSRILVLGVETREDIEDQPVVSRINANAVVGDAEDPVLAFSFR